MYVRAPQVHVVIRAAPCRQQSGWGAIFFFFLGGGGGGGQFSRELASLYEYSLWAQFLL